MGVHGLSHRILYTSTGLSKLCAFHLAVLTDLFVISIFSGGASGRFFRYVYSKLLPGQFSGDFPDENSRTSPRKPF